jgi:hypothetical protein
VLPRPTAATAADVEDPVESAARSARTSVIVWYRSPGALASRRRTSTARAEGSVAAPLPIEGSSRRIAAVVEGPSVRRNGCLPVNISHSRIPNENKSDRASTMSPIACSGDM